MKYIVLCAVIIVISGGIGVYLELHGATEPVLFWLLGSIMAVLATVAAFVGVISDES